MSIPPEQERTHVTRYVAVGVALFVAIFGLLPIANWIPGGHDAPWYHTTVSGWLSGTAIVVGVGIVLAILSGKIDRLWHDGACNGLIARYADHPVRAPLIIAGLAFALYCIVAIIVFSGKPLLIDEIAQTVQAQILVSGHLSRPVAAHPGFFSMMHMVDTNGRYFAQFPIGGPAMLAVGVLLGTPWIVGPLFGAIAVAAYAAYLRVAEPRAGVSLGAILVFAFAPFVVFMSGTYMNHVTTLAWLMIAVAALARDMESEAPRPGLALVAGLGFGIAATIRPGDALAFALPAGIWYLTRAIRDRRRWAEVLTAGIGVAGPIALLLWVNWRTTGSPLRFGYTLLWGKSVGLGFHAAPWGAPHTPARGLELINVYFLQLQTYLFETPLPSLIPLIGALALARRLQRFDRYLLASSGLLVTLYFAYWHQGFYPGPRFMYLLVPAAALWTARFLPELKARFGTGLAYRSAVYGVGTAGVMAATLLLPVRTAQYANGMFSARWDADSAAAAAQVENALVFVRESWGAQLVARLWALGVPRSKTELLYRRVDSCLLDQRLSQLERNGVRGTRATARLEQLLRDSAQTFASPFSPDSTEAYRRGVAYTPSCVARINDDRAGFTTLASLLTQHGGDNIYARDLHGYDSLLVRTFPERSIYLLKPPDARIGTPPRFYRLPKDSLWAAWRSGDSASIRLALTAPPTAAERESAAYRAGPASVTKGLEPLLGQPSDSVPPSGAERLRGPRRR